MPRVPGCAVGHVPHLADRQIGRGKAAQPLVDPEPLVRLQEDVRLGQIRQLLDGLLLLDRERRRYFDVLLDGKRDGANQIVACQRVIRTRLLET